MTIFIFCINTLQSSILQRFASLCLIVQSVAAVPANAQIWYFHSFFIYFTMTCYLLETFPWNGYSSSFILSLHVSSYEFFSCCLLKPTSEVADFSTLCWCCCSFWFSYWQLFWSSLLTFNWFTYIWLSLVSPFNPLISLLKKFVTPILKIKSIFLTVI